MKMITVRTSSSVQILMTVKPQESTTMSTARTQIFQNLQSVSASKSGGNDSYINMRPATSSQSSCFCKTGITRSWGRKKIYFWFPVAQELGKYKATLRSHSSPSPLTQTHTYIQKLTHFPPTCIQIPPWYTQAHCEATKQKQQAAQKHPRESQFTAQSI